MSNTDVSWRWDFVVFRLCNQNPTSNWRQILTSTRFSFSTKMQRLSDVMSNVNLMLHRRLVPAGQVQDTVLCKMRCTHSNICVELFWNSVVIQLTLILVVLNHWFLVVSSFGNTLCFSFTTKHSVSRTWRRRQQQHYSQNNSPAFFHCVYIWAELCKSSHNMT